MGASPEQLLEAHVENCLAVVADIDAELRPVEIRLEQRRRTADEHTDWRVVRDQRKELTRLTRMIAQLSKYQRT